MTGLSSSGSMRAARVATLLAAAANTALPSP